METRLLLLTDLLLSMSASSLEAMMTVPVLSLRPRPLGLEEMSFGHCNYVKKREIPFPTEKKKPWAHIDEIS